ncbi:phospholipid scramblase-related protein [Spirillospora albida]|uniref:phospholipid scramblase-related protein n=1 Tax=Spirillospora albida TaxID=58123 RepID=UPI0004BE86C3|nr:phospholipid scramblase-related protein [Spirillospora albida]
MSDVFASPNLRVEQPRRGPFAKSRYRVMDGDGTVLAIAAEKNDRRGLETLRTAIGKSDLDARAVLLTTPDGEPLLIIDKAAGRERTEIRTPVGELLGAFVTERIGRRYLLRDGEDTRVGLVTVDLGHNNFEVTAVQGGKVAHVRKKWAGLATHLLTNADKYDVEIFGTVPEPLRTMAAMTAIVMDMNLHESKDLV